MAKSEPCDCGTPFQIHTLENPQCSISNGTYKKPSYKIKPSSSESKKPIQKEIKILLIVIVVFVGLFLVTGNKSERSNEDQASTYCNNVKLQAQLKSIAAKNMRDNATDPVAIQTQLVAVHLDWLYYIVEESQCYTSSEIAEAKSLITVWSNL